jgi:RND family efflux transporter MFP subunit
MNLVIKIALPIAIVLSATTIAWILIVNKPQASQKPSEPPTLLVNSFVVEPEDVAISVTVSGTVEPHTETTLVSEVAGRIIEVSPTFLNGGFFNAGDVILRIDPRNHIAELKRTEAALVRARTQLAQEESLAKYERGDFEELKSTNPNVNTSDLSFRRTQLARAMADVVAAEAQVIRASGDVDRAEIHMPYAGIERQKRAELGQFVNPGTPLAVVFAIDFAEVRLPLSTVQVKKLALPNFQVVGSEAVQVTISGDSNKVWRGEIVRTEGVLDARSRILYAIARVQDPYGFMSGEDVEPLRIGTFVDVSIPGKSLPNVFTLERHMLKPGNKVWIIDDESRIRARTVTLAYADAQHAYISTGLIAGDRICVTPIDNPLPGTLVRVVEN